MSSQSTRHSKPFGPSWSFYPSFPCLALPCLPFPCLAFMSCLPRSCLPPFPCLSQTSIFQSPHPPCLAPFVKPAIHFPLPSHAIPPLSPCLAFPSSLPSCYHAPFPVGGFGPFFVASGSTAGISIGGGNGTEGAVCPVLVIRPRGFLDILRSVPVYSCARFLGSTYRSCSASRGMGFGPGRFTGMIRGCSGL